MLVLRDQYIPQRYLDVADHILSFSVDGDAKEFFMQIAPDSCWDLDMLQRHFQTIKEIDPKFPEGAKTVLSTCNKICL